MKDIQKNFLVGLILKKVATYDLESIREVNVNNSEYTKNIDLFVEENAQDTSLISLLIDYTSNEEVLFEQAGLVVEKIGLYVSVKKEDKFFIISQNVFREILITIESYMASYLPLGSVVKLDNKKMDVALDKELIVVIEQRMVHPKGKDYFIDYRAIPYPMGVFNEQMYVHFSIDDIESVIFEGYNDQENEGYELALKESLISSNIVSVKYQN